MAALRGFKDADLETYIDDKADTGLDKRIDFRAEIREIRQLE